MGYYLETDGGHGKAAALCQMYGAKRITEEQAKALLDDPNQAPICVVSNGFFEAAGFCFSKREFEAFSEPGDRRPKVWLAMDRKTAAEKSGYAERHKG